MAKEDEGERSEHRHSVTPRQRRRFSSAEVVDLITALFVLRQHDLGASVPGPLLARALRIESVITAAWAAEEERGANRQGQLWQDEASDDDSSDPA